MTLGKFPATLGFRILISKKRHGEELSGAAWLPQVRKAKGCSEATTVQGAHWWDCTAGGSADCDRAVPQVLQRPPPPLLVRAKANQPVECPPTSHAPLLEVGRSWEPFSSRFTLLRSQTPSPCPGSSSRLRHLTFAALRVPRATAAAPRGTKAQGSEY